MQNTRVKNILEIAAVIIFFSSFALSLLRPIDDPDVFWHLKTGEWIWQNKTLPDKDPFSFTTGLYAGETGETASEISFILRQYWLAQLIMHGFYQLGGFYGIIAFRSLVYLGIGLFLYFWMRKEGLGRLTSLIFLMPAIWFSTFWGGERPNIISFLFVVVVMYLLEDLKEACSEERVAGMPSTPYTLHPIRYMLLPLLMLIWTAMHTGFIIGDAVIFLYMAAEAAEGIILKKSGYFRQRKLFFAVGLTAILLTAYRVIPAVIRVREAYSFYSVMGEMLSSFAYAKEGNYLFLIIIAAVMLPLIAGVKRLYFRRVAVIIFLCVIALNSVRFIPFLVFTATMFAASIWGVSFDKTINKSLRFYVLYVVVILFALIISLDKAKDTVFKQPLIDPFYSKASVEFIKREKPEKELFNFYKSGGFLIWSLYPEYKVFMDGRTLSPAIFSSYSVILSGRAEEDNGIPIAAWKANLDAYRINTVLIPAMDADVYGTREFIRLVRRLVEDDEWRLVFADNQMLLFVRDVGKNREIIRRYSMPKTIAYEKALRQAEEFRTRFPEDWHAYETIGEINLYLGRSKVALSNFELAFKINPSLKESVLGKLTEEIRAGRDYSKLLDQPFL